MANSIDYRDFWKKHGTDKGNKKEEREMTEQEKIAAAEEENRKLRFWLKVAGIGVLVAGGCALYCYYDLRESRQMLTGAVDHIKNVADIHVDEQLVKKAVNEASYDVASKMASEAVKRVQSEMLGEIRMRVKTAVGDSKQAISDAVAEKIAKEVADVHKDEIMDTVINSATDKLTEKLEDDLGDEMTKVGEIYKNIVEALA